MTEQHATDPTTDRASFRVHVAPPWLLHLTGELDIAGAATLARALEGPIEHGGVIGLDVAELTFIDSTGIKALVQASHLLGERGRLVLFQPTSAVRRVIEICGLHEMLELDDAPAASRDGAESRSPDAPGRTWRPEAAASPHAGVAAPGDAGTPELTAR